jgi:hypothetical protein
MKCEVCLCFLTRFSIIKIHEIWPLVPKLISIEPCVCLSLVTVFLLLQFGLVLWAKYCCLSARRERFRWPQHCLKCPLALTPCSTCIPPVS